MSPIRLAFLVFAILLSCTQSIAQTDSSLLLIKKSDSVITYLQNLPEKYFAKLDNKIDKYSKRITGKTEKTLQRLSRWENKIKTLLEKANPVAAENLFGEGKLTFTLMLKKIQQGESLAASYKTQYNEYRDKVNTSLRYLSEQKDKLNSKLIAPINSSASKMNELEENVATTEMLEQLVRERKKQLLDAALKYIGKNRYVAKINKEAYYYTETLRNYKDLFSDPVKLENVITSLLKKIPAFNEFIGRNSGLSSLLPSSTFIPSGNNTGASNFSSMGYQSNASIVQSFQQSGFSGPNIQQYTQGNAGAFNSPLQELKDRFPGLSNTEDMPNFKPNEMKSKTFRQRLDFGTNMQFGKATNFLPGTADFGMQIAYKLNNNSNAGVGSSYKLGLGTGINNIKLSFAGLGLRSFLDWKLKGKFYVNGGFEYNYNSTVRSLRTLPSFNSSELSAWKPAALIGVHKKYKVGKVNGGVMILYDFLAKQKMPQTQSLIFRFGYNF